MVDDDVLDGECMHDCEIVLDGVLEKLALFDDVREELALAEALLEEDSVVEAVVVEDGDGVRDAV